MQDELVYNMNGLTQNASGLITITDYTQLALKTVTVNGNVLTEGTDFAKGASNEACATALAAAITALANVSAAAVGAVITIKADAPGVGGNAYNLLTNAAGGITLSAATLTGGVDATYTPSVELTNHGANAAEVDTVVDITAISGTGKTVTVTPQVSADGDNWIDRTPTAALNATGLTEIHTTEPLAYLRFKIVLGGTVDILVSGKINARPSLL